MNISLDNKQFLTIVNRVLIGAIAVALIYVVFTFVRTGFSQNLGDVSPLTKDITPRLSFELQDNATYQKIVSSRELFRPTTFAKKTGVKVTTIDDLTKDLLLVGVVSVDKKEAIIKNRRTRQTYFVTVGTNIGELKILSITDDKVEVGYKQERKELFIR